MKTAPTRSRTNALKLKASCALAVAVLFCGTVLAKQPPPTLPGGLTRVHSSKVALAYVRPGTVWTSYKTILLRPLSVPPNARNAAPPGQTAGFGESYLLTNADVTRLQQDFAKSMHNVLGNAGFKFVTTPQAGTLIVIPQLVKIDLNAPLYNTRATYAGMGFTVSQGGGSITMAAVLADGGTGKVIAEVLDRKYGSNIWQINNSVNNLAEAREIFDQWANDLSDKLTSN